MDIQKNTSLTFLFYDYETFGKNPALDKPSQFSCIQTDIDFNIIGSIQEIFCYPSVDYLPDPESVLITGISPKYTSLFGVNEFEFAKKIYSLFMKSDTCIIGYNNIYFDDEFTRNIFYRNFLNSYEWSWKNGNSRWDMLDLLRACYVLRPEGINWPRNEDNSVSLRLSDISLANNIVHNVAHNASSDVYATMNIAKLIKQKKPKLFNFFFKYRTKKAILTLIDVNSLNPIVYISRFFGVVNRYISYIVPILWHPINSNILVSIDLSQDVQKILNFFKRNSILNVNYKEIFLMGIRFIYVNRCPILIPTNVIRMKDRIRLRINYKLFQNNLVLLRKNIFLKKKLKKFLCSIAEAPKYNGSNVDLKMYNSFFSYIDNNVIKNIHSTLPKRIKINFMKYDNRINQLFILFLARYRPDMLDYSEKYFWIQRYLNIFSYANIQKYENKILKLIVKYKNHVRNVQLLEELFEYVKYTRKNFLKSIFTN
ncbi:exodeoxyribonuclease I [Buchnera aphidicola str. Bp (Baizongia pistaciae)]|uniref:Exodeoxyribonuclease I n=1 Tax=Buchnera aphidicola subsp. Baizongia pistaciae (strain Bp) TaxID=224915 RepID=EX1_BUCBP|nr:exodeoxyribonuclease I [Buchnera aphidicola]Q89A43.1 RecName: Full=Exodeoxyribonuclease I; Short=ExoI; Short=Exonuclease I; AltName: Full=DNA deoxyribophosphodiesterase; Short=dRPase [Buchnera aphidicola str. Bp (Baizongia pistaciae)]AAO27208.1 exodeoxyribonuclease I [Buchnera aphidicola str. Bp (Baizongia pistaciae)]